MEDKLCVFERRIRILYYLIVHKQTTVPRLSEEFCVSKTTIARDIVCLSHIAPIYTKQGNGGGIYILPEYRSYKNYLSDGEEDLLCSLMQRVNIKEKRILWDIIIKFSVNPTTVYSSFQEIIEKEELNAYKF